MTGIEQDLESIREGIAAGRFTNEAAVSQGIVLRLLHALSWPTYDTDVVWPEYLLSGKRVDFSLCHPRAKPIALIEVKQIGQSDGAERQLFEYAFHNGVPMAILTDGREWNFFLPGEQGDYGERRVYKLDIVERDIVESAARLRRCLLHDDVATGQAIRSAREDYQNVSRERQMQTALPKAWSKLIEEEDEMLLEIVADRVESICGFKPELDMVAAFFKSDIAASLRPVAETVPKVRSEARNTPPKVASPPTQLGGIGFVLHGQFHPSKNAIDTLRQVFEVLITLDPSFSDRFIAMKHGRTRRYLARQQIELYPGRPDLCQEDTIQLKSGVWMGTHYSTHTISRIIEMASGAAGLKFGSDFKINLGK